MLGVWEKCFAICSKMTKNCSNCLKTTIFDGFDAFWGTLKLFKNFEIFRFFDSKSKKTPHSQPSGTSRFFANSSLNRSGKVDCRFFSKKNPSTYDSYTPRASKTQIKSRGHPCGKKVHRRYFQTAKTRFSSTS